MDEATKELLRLGFPQNVLDAQQNGGAGFDVRLRFAMNLLTSSGIFNNLGLQIETPMDGLTAVSGVGSGDIVKRAIEVSDALFNQARDRGWIQPFDPNEPLSPALIEHAKRMGAFQYWQQMGANEQAQKNQPRVAPARPGLNG